ncbi:hypothetical protein MBCUT_13840 [Methanobrevibacter cuticularis]|uniref:Uncharacterized protein n=1 Tax=Methanobrevibacter cuticularis TaxID=47311 RepID=A0A166DIU8_9EURY|nr:hypothetical protein MBCUT_13840 [Methanobrevibacter cuticularis]
METQKIKLFKTFRYIEAIKKAIIDKIDNIKGLNKKSS